MILRSWITRILKPLVPLHEIITLLQKWWRMEENEIKKFLLKHGYSTKQLHQTWIDLGFSSTYERIPPEVIVTLMHRLLKKQLNYHNIHHMLSNAGFSEDEINQLEQLKDNRQPDPVDQPSIMVFPRQTD